MASEQESDDTAGDYASEKTDEAVAARRAAACAARGVDVIEPMENELFVDIDSHHGLGLFFANKLALGDLYSSHKMTPSPSRKAGRYHLRVTLSRSVKDAFERIMLQALLGSDLAREMVSWKEASLGLTKPTVFFEKKAKSDE